MKLFKNIFNRETKEIKLFQTLNGISLTEEQEKVISLKEGHHLILAPPGTGKTELLAQRVVKAIESGIKSESMICLTFTNRAAKIMKERVDSKYPDNKVFIGNIHSFCSSYIFNKKLQTRFYSLIDEEDSNQLLEEAKTSLKINADIYNPDYFRLNLYLKQLQYNFSPESILSVPSNIFNNLEAKKICQKYEELKSEYYLMDFDDLLVKTYLDLNNSEVEILFDWVQVDEVQDLNSLQLEIIKLISSNKSNIVYFGDQEQAIYSFLGSNLKKLNEISKSCQVYNLYKNFRSPSYILDMLIDFSKTNFSTKRISNPTSSKKINKKDDDMMLISTIGDSTNEAKYIISQLIPDFLNSEKGQTAILVRWNKTAELFSKLLQNMDIEHFKVSGFDLFHRKIIKDILAFHYCLKNEVDRVSWFRLYNIFGKINTIKESRQFVTQLYINGYLPSDLVNPLYENNSYLELFKMDYLDKRIVVFDTETTGLDVQRDEIIQIAAQEIIKGKLGKTFDIYLKTEVLLDKSESVHNISSDFLKNNGVERKKGFNEFINFIENSVIIAHNIKFDATILQNNLNKLEINIDILNQFSKYDSIEIVRRMFPKLNSHRLKDLLIEFNLTGINSHNALDDVLATSSLISFLAYQVSSLLTKQKVFFEANKQVFVNIKRYLLPLWKEYKLLENQQFTLAKSIDKLMNFLESNLNYEVEIDGLSYLKKLKKHMDFKCGEKNFKELIEVDLENYRHYKESDLLLGNEKIVISTVHKAKGLEFNNIIIPECVNEVYPSWSSKSQEEIEEDARTLYVALSRAMNRLIITTHSFSFNQYGRKFNRTPSRFLKSIEHHFKKIQMQ
jgi:DNA helicase-2/ATP-dependent DNA helicase PcrA